MSALSRREMLGSLGAIATAGGWLGLSAEEAVAQGGMGGTPRGYALPPLGYAYDALEPYIDAQTMELHHDKHHAGYVKGLNAAIEKLDAMRKSGGGAYADTRDLTDALSFNGSGHALHSVFWNNMKKGGGGNPSGSFAHIVDRDFGSADNLKAQFSNASSTVQGSGWGILAWEPLSGRLLVFAAEKHQNQTMWGVVPLLVLDVWEHAYYLHYQNQRGKYVDAFWNVVDWDNVAERASQAMKMT